MGYFGGRSFPWWRKRATVTGIAALGAILVVGAVSVAPSLLRPQTPAAGRHLIPALPGSDPDQSPAPEPVFHLAADDSKARVKIPQLGIDLPLVRGDGTNVPLYKAAIHPALSPPGDGVRSMIYAHAQNGMFGPLLAAAQAGTGGVGDAVEVDRADGKVLHYVIRQFFPRWSINDTRWLQPVSHEELILVTCTTYNLSDPRVVAVAEPV
ncbi:MAG TPA: sortase [Candidatus Dormibacteraeota bacterium]|nr:sortase [Candidatus Dormibacteraeota bacterium]